jgi:hypothetical protein
MLENGHQFANIGHVRLNVCEIQIQSAEHRDSWFARLATVSSAAPADAGLPSQTAESTLTRSLQFSIRPFCVVRPVAGRITQDYSRQTGRRSRDPSRVRL